MDILRTPDSRFENLKDFPFTPRYENVPDGEGGTLRIHYLDEGVSNGPPILFMHGQPSWSYLYRKMIPILVDAGYRVIAPDLVGFGRSDKPTSRESHTYARHVAWMTAWFEQLRLHDVTLYCQDWGGLIGLRVVAAKPACFSRIVAANTGLPFNSIVPQMVEDMVRSMYAELPVLPLTEIVEKFSDHSGVPGFLYWQKYCDRKQPLYVGDIFRLLATTRLPDEVIAAYEAPFPDERFMAGVRQLPLLVPLYSDHPELPANRLAWKVLGNCSLPFQTAFSDQDPVTIGGEQVFQKRVAGAKDVEHVTIRGAGHFLQEDQGVRCAEELLAFIKKTSQVSSTPALL